MDIEFVDKKGKGKREYQRLKPYLVFEYLMRESDKNNPINADGIIAYLQGSGINAERRGIYKDIEEINLIQIMLEENCSVQEAIEILEEYPERKTVISGKKGFYVMRDDYAVDDIRLLAECVYAAKFISQKQADALTKIVFDERFISRRQTEKIRHNALVVGRVKSENSEVYNSVGIINDAMSTDNKHIPKKISFKYLRYSISDMTQHVRGKGEKHTASPYQLLINDGNYYLLAFDDISQKIKPYRVDRMKDVRELEEARCGEKEFEKIDLNTYTQSVFGMFNGKKQRVTLSFIASLLDTMIDRFGKNVYYAKIDDHHCRTSVEVEISPQFFAWICGFGDRVVIETPEVAEQYLKHLEKIKGKYEKEAKKNKKML